MLSLFFAQGSVFASGKQSVNDLQAYRGAPPTIPHNVRELGRKKCLSCHFRGLDLGIKGGEAYKTPHPERANCLQCHLPQKETELFKENKFVPLKPKKKTFFEKKD